MPKTGLLIIHGTLGSPNEFVKVEAILRKQGYLTRAISLPGHGEFLNHSLSTVSAQTMLIHCRKEYKELAQQCDDVFILGHSLGGILSLIIAAENPEKLVGVMAFGAAYEHAYFVNYFHGFFAFPIKNILTGLWYAPQVYTGNKAPLFMPWMFPKLRRESKWLLKQLQETLPCIDVPVQLAHSPHDMVVPYGEMVKIANRIAKPGKVKMHHFQYCGHQIFPHSREQEAGVKLILDFIADRSRNYAY